MQSFFELDFRYAASVPFEKNQKAAQRAQGILEEQSGPGSEFLGWLDLPPSLSEELLTKIDTSASLMRKAQALVVIGIGGSYLGTRAVLEGLQAPFEKPILPVYFAGHQMDAAYHQGLLNFLANKRYALNVISKSGTTTEPALAFRLLWEDLRERFSPEELKQLVFTTTDAQKGSLKKLAREYGLNSFIIPEDVGGRYSVFTPVGLLPLAAAGIPIRRLIEGAAKMRELLKGVDFNSNPALQYAAYRHGAYQAGKKIEILASYQQNLFYLAEWWKQLFGESEGKEGKGIYPASVNLSTDLHSLGQWMQEGERIIFETVLEITEVKGPRIPQRQDDLDGLNYLAGKELHAINRSATEATLAAHQAGQVPCLRIRLKELNANSLGALMYFFEYTCAVSAYMLDVNPFNQPGVEAYKQNMFRLLREL